MCVFKVVECILNLVLNTVMSVCNEYCKRQNTSELITADMHGLTQGLIGN